MAFNTHVWRTCIHRQRLRYKYVGAPRNDEYTRTLHELRQTPCQVVCEKPSSKHKIDNIQRTVTIKLKMPLHLQYTGGIELILCLGGGIKRCCCLKSVCLSVTYIGHNSRTVRSRKTKIGTQVAHLTRDSDTTFKSKGQKSTCRGVGILWRTRVHR